MIDNPMKAAPTREDAALVPQEVADLVRQIEQLREERDHLLAHSQNLEAELRRAAREPARIRDLEERLAVAEAQLRKVSVVHTARWLVLQPDKAAVRVYRKLRDGLGWRILERYRRFRLRRRQAKA